MLHELAVFYRHIQCKVEKATGQHVSIGRLGTKLSRSRLDDLIIGDGNAKKVLFKFEQMDEEGSALVNVLKLKRFVPNKA